MHKATIISTKHNGAIHRSWSTAWIHSSDPPVLFIPAGTAVHNPDSSLWSSSYDVEAYFYHTLWFNVFALLKDEGTEWYCNIAAPPRWENNGDQLWFVDYDLDVYVYADGRCKVLDREEYEEHAHAMQYPATVKTQVAQGLANLMQQIEDHTGPFAKLT